MSDKINLRALKNKAIKSAPSIDVGAIKEKAVKAYHQITFNTNLNSHEKFLTLLHELGHLYCGHINGVSTKVNNIPSYRYGAEMNALEKMKSDLVELDKKIELTKGNTSDKSVPCSPIVSVIASTLRFIPVGFI